MEAILSFVYNPVLAVPTALLILIVVIYVVGVWNFRVLRSLNIPGPKPLPYLGNLLDSNKNGHGTSHLSILEYMKKYGKIFSLCIGRSVGVVVTDPDVIKQITIKDSNFFTNHHRHHELAKERKGLFFLKNGDWKRVRSALNPTFTTEKLMPVIVPAIESSKKTLMGKLQGIADTGKSVDMLSWFSLMTLEVILSTSFGIKSPVQTEGPSNKFHVKAKGVFKEDAMMFLPLMLPFRKFWGRIFIMFQTNFKFFVETTRNILKTRKEEEIQGPQTVFEIMLSVKNSDGTLKLSDDEMVGQSIEFMYAGHETSSNALAMAVYYLALNPDIQERLRTDILSAQQANPEQSLHELVNDLEYLDCVVNEVMRLSPPIHITDRSCSRDYKLNDATTIPAGMAVIIPIYALHHDPLAWPDPEKFDPERFRGSAKQSRHPFQFLPFGGGSRTCLGKRFALSVIKITLADVLAKYKFVRCPETEVPLKMIAGITLIPENGVYVRVESWN